MPRAQYKLDFTDRILRLRERKKLSQTEFGKIFDLTSSVVSAYEKGIRTPSHEVLVKIADYFHVKMDYMYGREEVNFDYTYINFDKREGFLTERQAACVKEIISLFEESNGLPNNINHLIEERMNRE